MSWLRCRRWEGNTGMRQDASRGTHIRAAALELFVRWDYEATTMGAIGEAVGIQRSSLNKLIGPDWESTRYSLTNPGAPFQPGSVVADGLGVLFAHGSVCCSRSSL
jgi:hypothetical protein